MLVTCAYYNLRPPSAVHAYRPDSYYATPTREWCNLCGNGADTEIRVRLDHCTLLDRPCMHPSAIEWSSAYQWRIWRQEAICLIWIVPIAIWIVPTDEFDQRVHRLPLMEVRHGEHGAQQVIEQITLNLMSHGCNVNHVLWPWLLTVRNESSWIVLGVNDFT